MKRFIAFIALFLMTAGALFADTIFKSDDFYSPWIVGTWKMMFSLDDGSYVDCAEGYVDITGNTPESQVVVYNDDGFREEESLEVFADDFMSEIGQGTANGFGTDGEEETLDYLRLMGADVSGDMNLHVNDEHNLIYMSFSASYENEKIVLEIKMAKVEQSQQ